jgi:hypothetical protein
MLNIPLTNPLVYKSGLIIRPTLNWINASINTAVTLALIILTDFLVNINIANILVVKILQCQLCLKLH